MEIIRNDPTIGRGSLTDIDETWTDQELVEYLDEQEIYTSRAALHEMKAVSSIAIEGIREEIANAKYHRRNW